MNDKVSNIFQDVIGQKHLTEKFSRIIPSGRLHHAYILSGKEGSGRESFALEILKLINCKENKQGVFGKYCGKCESCKTFKKHSEEDLLYIYPDPLKKSDPEKKVLEYKRNFSIELNKKIEYNGYYNFSFGKGNYITIDKIRNIRTFSNYNSIYGYSRAVFIICSDLMNKEAQNSLLKILEEPPQNFIFFLITERPGGLISTIHSRTIQLKFSNISDNECKEIIEQYYPDKSKNINLPDFIKFSDGNFKRVLENLNSGEDKILTAYNLFKKYFNSSVIEVGKQIDEFQSYLKQFLSMDEIKFLFEKVKATYVNNKMNKKEIDISDLENFTTEINDLLYMYQRNINPKLIFLNFYLNHHKVG